MQEPLEGAEQSYSAPRRGATRRSAKVMELHTNSSNNTIYADADGNIAYFHAQLHPEARHEVRLDKPVDGSDPATEWHGVHGDRRDSPNVLNPPNGWLYNTNNWPWSAAGPEQPEAGGLSRLHGRRRREPARHPRDPGAARTGRTSRSIGCATRRSTAISPAFAQLVPPLLAAYDSTAGGDPLKAKLAEQIDAAARVGLPLVGELGADVARRVLGRGSWRSARGAERGRPGGLRLHGDAATPRAEARRRSPPRSDKLTARLRHLEDAVGRDQPLPAPHRRHRAAVQRRGAEHPGAVHLGALGLARVVRRAHLPGTKRMYGTSGNSFVAVVEFGRTACGRGR